MSEHRKPAAFRLDDPHVVVSEASERTRLAAGEVRVTPEPEPAAAIPVEVPPAPPARSRWGTLLWSALAGLVALAFGLAVTALIEGLYARTAWLGTLGLALAALAGLAFLVIAAREIVALVRLARIEKLQARAAAALATDDRDAARAVVRDLIDLLGAAPQLARPRAELEAHLGEIIDGADLIRLAERKLMAPLDAQACRLVAGAAKRVSVVTAVSPRALLDMAFVLIAALTLIRRLAALYGGRPGSLGLIRLVRHTVAHLAVTGGMAAGDSLIQQALGHGIAAKISARLGEGVLNGLLTARLGLAAIEVSRPLPFVGLPRPAVGDVAADLIRRDKGAEGT